MIFKTTLLITLLSLLSGCVNKHGISAKYYSECKEYYDLQGYYHNDCGDDDIITYKSVKKSVKKSIDYISGEDRKKDKNVW